MDKPTPIVDAAEIDALTLDIPGQQTTDKVVRSFIARDLERRLSAMQADARDARCFQILTERHWICAYAPSGDWSVFVNPNGSDKLHGGGMQYGKTAYEAIRNAVVAEDGTDAALNAREGKERSTTAELQKSRLEP